jgi:uncharacterized membrane protein YfcA
VFSFLDTLSTGSLAFLLVSALVAGLARGFSGFGGALIFVPLASTVVGPQMAAPLLLLIDGVGALGLVPRAWRGADKRDVATMAAGAMLGVPLGTWLLTHSDPVALRWGIALLTLSLLVLLVSGWRYRGRPAVPLTVGVGSIAGVLGGAAQVGGPPVVAYWLGGAIPATTVRFNIVLYFFISTFSAPPPISTAAFSPSRSWASPSSSDPHMRAGSRSARACSGSPTRWCSAASVTPSSPAPPS